MFISMLISINIIIYMLILTLIKSIKSPIVSYIYIYRVSNNYTFVNILTDYVNVIALFVLKFNKNLIELIEKKVFCRFTPRGFNGSVNIPERCDFRSQFYPLSTFF